MHSTLAPGIKDEGVIDALGLTEQMKTLGGVFWSPEAKPHLISTRRQRTAPKSPKAWWSSTRPGEGRYRGGRESQSKELSTVQDTETYLPVYRAPQTLAILVLRGGAAGTIKMSAEWS